MKFLKEYWQLIVIGLLLIIIFFGGFFWGKTLADNKLIKKEKEEYLEVKKQQDSIITVLTKDKTILLDSINIKVKDAIAKNDGTDRRIILVKENDEKLYKEVNSIPFNTVDSNTRLFNKLADEYNPG